MSRIALVAIALVATTLALPAHAQLGGLLKKATGNSSNSPTSSSTPPDAAAQDALVQRFARSQGYSVDAQIAFAEAFGLSDQVKLLEAERIAMSSGAADVSKMKKTQSVTENAQAAIDARLAEEPKLNDEARGHYADGLVSLLQAVNEGRSLPAEASSFSNGIAGGNALQIATLSRKMAAGAWVAKEVPGYVKGLYSSSKQAMTFARSNKVKLPPNADSMLDNL
jgi:hypothetical protein